MGKKFWINVGSAVAFGLFFIVGPMVLIPGWPHSGFFAGCGRGLSDKEIMILAAQNADSLISEGYCHRSQRDSLVTLFTAKALWGWKRGEALVREMRKTPDLETNTAALYGLALGFELEVYPDSVIYYLDKAVALGDFQLSFAEEVQRFASMAEDHQFNNLMVESQMNYHIKLEEIGLEAARRIQRKPPRED